MESTLVEIGIHKKCFYSWSNTHQTASMCFSLLLLTISSKYTIIKTFKFPARILLYSLGKWLIHWLIQKALPGIWSGYSGFWRLFSIHRFLWSSFNSRHWLNQDKVKHQAQPSWSNDSLTKGRGYQFLIIRLLRLQ